MVARIDWSHWAAWVKLCHHLLKSLWKRLKRGFEIAFHNTSLHESLVETIRFVLVELHVHEVRIKDSNSFLTMTLSGALLVQMYQSLKTLHIPFLLDHCSFKIFPLLLLFFLVQSFNRSLGLLSCLWDLRLIYMLAWKFCILEEVLQAYQFIWLR